MTTANALADAAAAKADSLGRVLLGRWARAVQAIARCHAGDLPEARAAVAALELLEDPGGGLLHAEAGRARGWLAAAEGHRSAAVEELLDSAGEAAGAGGRGEAVWIYLDAVRLGGATTARMPLGTLAEELATPIAIASAQWAGAKSADDLIEVAARFTELGLVLHAAEAWTAVADARVREGRRSLAAEPAARATELAARCPGARPPTLLQGGAPGAMTPREREVAALAAGGLSNRAIAERLRLSVRTVENRLQAVYERLGLEGREQLAAALDASGKGGRQPEGD